MPELPEVETVCRGLAPFMVNQTIESVEQNRSNLRFPFPRNFVQVLTDSVVTKLERRAKYALCTLDKGYILVMHLGMSGRFSILPKGDAINPGNFEHSLNTNPKHDHVVFHMSDGTEIRYNDPRRFGFMELIDQDRLYDHKFFKSLGIEPLSDKFDADYLANKAHEKSTSLKAFLLDQRVVAGLGNIYVCEALFRSKLSPEKPANVLATTRGKANKKAKLLVDNIKLVLQAAIEAGGSTLQDHRQTDGSLGYFQHSFQVYGREGAVCLAPKCGGVVERITQNGRSTFLCRKCQR